MRAFQPTGPLLTFTTAAAAPTSVQAVTLTNEQSQFYMLTNTSATIDNVIGWGQSDAQAKLNAAAGATECNCVYLLRNTQVIIAAAPGAYFSGISVSAANAITFVQAGNLS